MRLGCGSFFLLWKLNSISLGKSTVYLHKCPALGLRNYHIDVSSREETECSKDDKTVGPDGHLEESSVMEVLLSLICFCVNLKCGILGLSFSLFTAVNCLVWGVAFAS